MAPRSALLAMSLLLVLPAGARAATADLSVGMDGPEFAVVDAEAPYTVTVTNAGPSTATGVTVSDPIPAGARYVRTSGDGTCTPGAMLRCTLPSLAAGRTATMTIVLAGTTVGAKVHHAVAVTATSTDPTSGDLAADVDTTITAPSVAPPPIVLTGPPCANVRRGTRDDDVLVGTAFGDTLFGLEGSDLLRGGDGNDCLWGGEGQDVLDADGGDDALWGGNGRDHLAGGAGNDRLYGGLKGDALSGGSGNDQLFPGTGRDRVLAGAGDDVVSARDGSRDVIECGPGNDRATVDRRDVVKGCEQVARR